MNQVLPLLQDAPQEFDLREFWRSRGGPVGAGLSRGLPAVPGGLAVKTGIALAGGFLGWEMGTLNLKNTDWVSLGSQVAAATGGYLAAQGILGAAGLMAGGPVALGVSIAAALATGTLVDLARNKKLESPL